MNLEFAPSIVCCFFVLQIWTDYHAKYTVQSVINRLSQINLVLVKIVTDFPILLLNLEKKKSMTFKYYSE